MSKNLENSNIMLTFVMPNRKNKIMPAPFRENAVERYDRLRYERMSAGWSNSDASNYAADKINSVMGNLRGPCDWRSGKSFKG